jgi:DNA-binding NtrC family response regulator
VKRRRVLDSSHRHSSTSTVSPGKTALADGARMDLIFGDIVMPGTIDGVGLATEVRTLHPDLQVVLTIGYSDARGQCLRICEFRRRGKAARIRVIARHVVLSNRG